MGKGKSEDEHKVRIERFSERLMCALTDDEIRDRSHKAAHILGDRDNLEAQLKEYVGGEKSRIKRMDGEHRRLSAEVRERVTEREVKCERRYNYRLGTVTDVRLDTGESLNERPMSAEERQMHFPEDAPDIDDEFGEGDDPGESHASPEPEEKPKPRGRGRRRKTSEEQQPDA